MWSFSFAESLRRDLRFGFRLLAKSSGFTALAVITLALGIGANTAIFSLINAVMLRSLPVQNPSQLVVLRWTAREEPRRNGTSSFGDCSDERRARIPPAARFRIPSLRRFARRMCFPASPHLPAQRRSCCPATARHGWRAAKWFPGTTSQLSA
jgi:hypothetical protein